MESTDQRRHVAISLAVTLLVLSGLGIAQTGQFMKPNAHPRSYNPAPGWNRTQTLACIYLGEPTEEGVANRIEVKENPPASKAPMFEVDFIADWPASPKTLLVYPEGYSFINAFMLDRHILISFWSAADTGVVQTFHLIKGGATLVFEKSGWSRIETWHSTILLDESTIGPDRNYHYTTAEIWQWNGKQFKLVTTVPYVQRLEALAKLEQGGKTK